MKRGQVSLFIIIAIVLVILIIVIIFFSRRGAMDLKKNDISSLSQKGKLVYSEIESCLKDKAYEGLIELGRYGGYYNLPKQINYAGIPYYYFDNKSTYPSIDIIQKQLSLFMKENTELCPYIVNNSDFEIKLIGDINSNTIIEPNQVNFKITYPISISNNNYTASFDNFDFSIPIRFGKIYNISLEFLEKDVKESEGLCITCLKNVSEKNNLDFSALDYGNGDFVIYFKDIYNSNERSVYLFRFAIKYEMK